MKKYHPMAKRFIDTDIFKKQFIRGLDPRSKLFFFYLITDCNHAGIWDCDWEVASIRCGCDLDKDFVIENFKGKLVLFDDDTKIFIPSFIEFQYGELNPENRAHKSVIDILNKYNLDKIKPLTRPFQGCKDMDKDQYKDMDKVKVDRGGMGEKDLNIPFDAFWDAYKKKVGEKDKLSKKWSKLTDEERVLIMEYVPKYVMVTPVKKFRKNPETFLNNKSWLDELPQTDVTSFDKPIEERDAEFKDNLRAFKKDYDSDMLSSFYAHWSERNETGDMMRFELEPTWELEKRLFNWHSRQNSKR